MLKVRTERRTQVHVVPVTAVRSHPELKLGNARILVTVLNIKCEKSFGGSRVHSLQTRKKWHKWAIATEKKSSGRTARERNDGFDCSGLFWYSPSLPSRTSATKSPKHCRHKFWDKCKIQSQSILFNHFIITRENISDEPTYSKNWEQYGLLGCNGV
jgi:hypothetical protein